MKATAGNQEEYKYQMGKIQNKVKLRSGTPRFKFTGLKFKRGPSLQNKPYIAKGGHNDQFDDVNKSSTVLISII